MGFATLEEAQAAYDELKPKYDALEGEKTSLLRKRDELLGEVKGLKTKYSKFADYADRDDLDIAELLRIKEQHETGDSAIENKYRTAYEADKKKFDDRLKAIEDERRTEKEEREREKAATTLAQLKADAIAEFSKESYGIRNPEQFWILYGQGKIQRGEDGKVFVGDEYKQVGLADYVKSIADEPDNQHHFKPKGGSGAGTVVGNGGGNGQATTNPWKAGSFNLTQQGQIIRTNPELAKRLKAEAGVK